MLRRGLHGKGHKITRILGLYLNQILGLVDGYRRKIMGLGAKTPLDGREFAHRLHSSFPAHFLASSVASSSELLPS